METTGQTTNISDNLPTHRAPSRLARRRPIGVIASLALAQRAREQGRQEESLDPWEHEGRAPKISREDEADLKLLFSEELRTTAEGGAASNFGAMTDRLELYSQAPIPCKHCGGIRQVTDRVTTIVEGEVVSIERVVVEEKQGSGSELDSARFKEWMRIEKLCHRPTGPAQVQAWLLEHNRAFSWEFNGKKWVKEFEDYGDYFCQTCEGWGWIFRKPPKTDPTVDITGEIPRFVPPRLIGETESIVRLGRTIRRRAQVRAFDEVAEVCLESWFSPDGGDARCLWHHTPTGRELLAENHLKLPPKAYFDVLRLTQDTNRDKGLQAKFTRANIEAEQLSRRMARVWHKVAVDD